MVQTFKITIDHKEIIEWSEKYGGKPAIIDEEDSDSDVTGIRINFPGNEDDIFFSGKNVFRETSWNRFFNEFEKRNFAFVYLENPKTQDLSLAYRFINRDNIDLNETQSN